MIKLEIIVRPKSEKCLEFSQTLEFIKPDLEQICTLIQIIEEDNKYSINMNVDSVQELTNILHSKELSILSGAIRTLCEKSEIVIHGIGHKRKGNDLREIRLNYLKRNKKTITL